eukprot:11579442-Heterocapsa_arctica.AAC.1
MSHNGVLSTEDTIPWGYIDIVYITPRSGERWVLYDHRLTPMTSEGYQEPEGRIPCMTTARLDIQDLFGLWIDRKKGNIPWRWCPLASCACALPAAYT